MDVETMILINFFLSICPVFACLKMLLCAVQFISNELFGVTFVRVLTLQPLIFCNMGCYLTRFKFMFG